MLEYIALVAIAALVLFFIVHYANQRGEKSKVTTIPGLEPSDPNDGNLAEMGKAGSLHEFLVGLHGRFGSLASFWMGKQLMISTATPELFKQTLHAFDRPPILFQVFKPLWTEESITYANGAEGRKRRSHYDVSYSHGAVSLDCDLFLQIGKEFRDRILNAPKDEHIALYENTFAMGLKSITMTSFGPVFHDHQEVLNFHNVYEICWTEIEKQLIGDLPVKDSPRIQRFEEGKRCMWTAIKKAIADRRQRPPAEGDELLVDWLIKYAGSETEIIADGVTYVIAGAHTTALTLAWGLYYLTLYPEIQEKVHQEMVEVLGDQNITGDVVPQLVYLRQVIDETLRCSIMAPYAARVQDQDFTLDGHVVKAGTPVVQALGVVLSDPNLWPEPEKFDPDRFSPGNKKKLKPYAFEPFGFAGKRKCPGYRFAYMEATVILSVLLRTFRFKLVEGQVVTPVYGLVTKPAEEIWVTAERRCIKKIP